MDNFYRPLPDFVTIRESNIDGLGLYATKVIPQLNKKIGMM